MLQQVGNPFCVLHVRLVTRYRFDMLCIGHHEFEETLQAPVDLQPIDSRALHAHVRTSFLQQPGA